MALKHQVPTFEKGSPNLGDQLRELAKVVVALCEAVEANEKASEEAKATEAPKTTSRTAKATAAK